MGRRKPPRRHNSIGDVFAHARQRKYAVGAFNISTIETLKGVVAAAERLRAPVVIETSMGETEYLGVKQIAAVVAAYAQAATVPIFLNLDHTRTFAAVTAGIDAGYDLIHYDGSLLPPEENMRVLRRVVPRAHANGALVEGEREHISGGSQLHRRRFARPTEHDLTDPDIARDFVKATGIDVLAISVGEAHGLYQGAKTIDVRRIQQIRRAVPCYLSLHGGSGIPGRLIRRAVAAGVTKMNVNTELRLAYTSALRRVLTRKSIVPYEYLPAVVDAVRRVVEKKILLLGSAGQADRL